MGAGCRDLRFTLATHHDSPGENRIASRLLGRKGFTGQGRLIEREAERGGELAVSRDTRAGRQHEHVARHDRFGADTDRLAIASHAGTRRGDALKRRDRALGPEFIADFDANEDQDDGNNRQGIAELTPEAVEEPHDQQEQDHWLGDFFGGDVPEANRCRREQAIGPVAFQVLRRCGGCQATSALWDHVTTLLTHLVHTGGGGSFIWLSEPDLWPLGSDLPQPDGP